MSKKLLTLVVLTSSPTVTDDISAGYEIGQQWLNTVTGTMYQMVSDGVWNPVGGSSTPSVNYIDFNSALADPAYLEGRVFWNQQDHALSFHTDVSGTSIQIGQEQVTRIVNKTGSTILNGQVVYVNGAQGNRPTVALAQADSVSADKILGVATNDIADNAEGYITLVGLVRDINTSAFTAGDRLWLSATTAGAFTNVEPSEPNHKVCVGTVLNSTVSGMICVRIQHHTTKTELGLGTSNSPTFAALTLTGDLTFSGGSLVTALSDKQPLDSDLTAIAALTTTAYGRSFLTLTDATAARNYIELGAANSPTFTNLNLTTSITFSTDTNLYRAAANSLKTDDSLTVVGSIIPDQNNGVNSGTTAGVTRYSGGVTNDGAVIVLGGSTHSTSANKGMLRIGATDVASWIASTFTVTGDIVISGTMKHSGASSNPWMQYAVNDTRIINLDIYGGISFRNTANNADLFRVLNTGAATLSSSLTIGGALSSTVTDALTNATTDSIVIDHNLSSGTAVAGMGVGIRMRAKSATVASRPQASILSKWIVATDASRTAQLSLYVNDYLADREAIRAYTTGSDVAISLFGTTTITGTSAGTPSATQVLIGNGEIKTGGAATFAGLTTIDTGSGSHGLSTAGVGIFLSAANSTGTGLKTATFGSAAGTTISSWNIGGTRASQSATIDASSFFQFVARGHDGTSSTGSQAAYSIISDGLWSGSNRGTYHVWNGTPNGSTSETEWMRLYRGVLYVYGSVPGTPGTNQVLIGGGALSAYGNVRAGLIELGSGGEIRMPGYDGDTDIAVNYTGYNGGTTRFRSVKFYDGKNALIATLDGATKTATFGGLVKAAGSTDEQLRIGQLATIDSYGYQIGRQSAAGSNLGFLVFYGPQAGYGGYAFRNVDNGDLLRLANDGTATFYGTASPGTPTSNQVLIGAGQVACPSGQGIYIGGNARFTGDASYSHVRSPSGDTRIYVANSATYYDNDAHSFRNAAGSSYGSVSCGALSASGFVNIAGSNSTPGSSGAAGSTGDIRFDSSYIYVCVAANTWKRAALSTW